MSQYYYNHNFDASFNPPNAAYSGFMGYPPVPSDAFHAGQAGYVSHVDGTLHTPLDNANFIGALAALDEQSFDYLCRVLVPQAALGHQVYQTNLLPTTMEYTRLAGVAMNNTNYDAFSEMLPPEAFAYSDVGQPHSLDQHSQTAIAVQTNISQETNYAMPDFDIASPETTSTSTIPSSSSSPQPTTPPEAEDSPLPPTSAQGTRRRAKGQGRHSSPTSVIPCPRIGCNRKFSKHWGVRRHERTFHDGESWYCPGLDAVYAPGEEVCECPPHGYSRNDALLKHLRERGPTTPCYEGAIALKWHPDDQGSIKYLKDYQPGRLQA